ncbi:MAG: Csp1 family four helix bundle copper storage protein [Nitrosomonadales bacterium]|nr:Csp1 family four helix bundle copper storage protein [Nitrosomonadales bacterium]
MNRRELLLGAAAMAAAATTGQAFAATHEHDHMSMHDHHGTMAHDGKLIAAAADCVAKANLCLQHCLVSLGKGDTELAACAQSSSQVIAMCNALLEMSAANSKHLPRLAKVAMDVCKECEEECKKTQKHPECKACMEACAACYAECKKIAA